RAWRRALLGGAALACRSRRGVAAARRGGRGRRGCRSSRPRGAGASGPGTRPRLARRADTRMPSRQSTGRPARGPARPPVGPFLSRQCVVSDAATPNACRLFALFALAALLYLRAQGRMAVLALSGAPRIRHAGGLGADTPARCAVLAVSAAPADRLGD